MKEQVCLAFCKADTNRRNSRKVTEGYQRKKIERKNQIQTEKKNINAFHEIDNAIK